MPNSSINPASLTFTQLHNAVQGEFSDKQRNEFLVYSKKGGISTASWLRAGRKQKIAARKAILQTVVNEYGDEESFLFGGKAVSLREYIRKALKTPLYKSRSYFDHNAKQLLHVIEEIRANALTERYQQHYAKTEPIKDKNASAKSEKFDKQVVFSTDEHNLHKLKTEAAIARDRAKITYELNSKGRASSGVNPAKIDDICGTRALLREAIARDLASSVKNITPPYVLPISRFYDIADSIVAENSLKIENFDCYSDSLTTDMITQLINKLGEKGLPTRCLQLLHKAPAISAILNRLQSDMAIELGELSAAASNIDTEIDALPSAFHQTIKQSLKGSIADSKATLTESSDIITQLHREMYSVDFYNGDDAASPALERLSHLQQRLETSLDKLKDADRKLIEYESRLDKKQTQVVASKSGGALTSADSEKSSNKAIELIVGNKNRILELRLKLSSAMAQTRHAMETASKAVSGLQEVAASEAPVPLGFTALIPFNTSVKNNLRAAVFSAKHAFDDIIQSEIHSPKVTKKSTLRRFFSRKAQEPKRIEDAPLPASSPGSALLSAEKKLIKKSRAILELVSKNAQKTLERIEKELPENFAPESAGYKKLRNDFLGKVGAKVSDYVTEEYFKNRPSGQQRLDGVIVRTYSIVYAVVSSLYPQSDKDKRIRVGGIGERTISNYLDQEAERSDIDFDLNIDLFKKPGEKRHTAPHIVVQIRKQQKLYTDILEKLRARFQYNFDRPEKSYYASLEAGDYDILYDAIEVQAELHADIETALQQAKNAREANAAQKEIASLNEALEILNTQRLYLTALLMAQSFKFPPGETAASKPYA